jgi:hypothetical protein
MMIRRIAVLFASVAFAWIGAFGAEIPVDGPAYGPAPRNQWRASAASDGDRYLVLWDDERTEARQKHVTRVSGSGAALDPNGIRVRSRSTGPGHVVWAGNAWFVVSEGEWDDEREHHGEPELTRIDRNGRVLDPEPRTLPIHPHTGITLATDGQHVIVGYDRGRLSEKRVLVLDAEGEAIADFPLSPVGATTTPGPPSIGSNGSVFAALWVNGAMQSDGSRSIEGVRFGPNGTLGPARPVFGSFSQSTPTMASDGRDFIVIQERGVYRMTADLAVEFLFGSPFEYAQAIVWTGSAYALVVGPSTGDSRDVKIVSLDRDGRPLGERTLRLEGSAAGLSGRAAASNGETLLLAWHDATEAKPTTVETFTDTYAATVSLPELALGPRRLLSVSATRQSRPATASSTVHRVTVWQEGTELYARRHFRDGSPDGPSLRLSASISSADVVFNGSAFIVASTEGSMVVTRRLSSSGPLRVEGESRIDGGSLPLHVALASSGPVTLVAWFDNRGYNLHGGVVYAARTGVDGSWIEHDPVQLAPSELASSVQKIAVSPNGAGELLVVWGGTNRFCNCSPPSPPMSDVLRAARVTQTLTILDARPIEVVVPVDFFDSRGWPDEGLYDPAHSLYVDHPSVTWNGNEWLVVWNRAFRTAAAGGDWSVREEIRGRRIARNGTLLDGPASDPGILIARDAFAPSVAWTGAAYLLAWYEGLPNHRDSMELYRFPLLRLRAASFDRIGGFLSNVRTIGESKWADPVSFSVANGVAISAYARIADEPQYGGISRAFLEVPTSGSKRRAARH